MMYLIFHVTSQHPFLRGHFRWEHLVVRQQPDKFGDHRRCDNEDILFLILLLTSRDHMFKRLYRFMGGSISL